MVSAVPVGRPVPNQPHNSASVARRSLYSRQPENSGALLPSQRSGVIDHMAFSATNLKAVKARFDERGLKYDLRRQAGAGTWQLFTYDPNGAKVELDFVKEEPEASNLKTA